MIKKFKAKNAISNNLNKLVNKGNYNTIYARQKAVKGVKSGSSGVGGSGLIFVKPLEQAQADGKISVKQIMPTLSAMNDSTAFDMYMFGDKSSCTLSAVANSYGIDSTSFTLFNSSTGAGTLMIAGKVKNFATGDYEFVSVQPVFIKTDPCEAEE